MPTADATILLDVDPEAAHRRKARDRDRYEPDMDLLGRVRREYRRLAVKHDWIVIDGTREPDAVTEEAWARLEPLLKRARNLRAAETDERIAAADERA